MLEENTNIRFHFLKPVHVLKRRNQLKAFLVELAHREGMAIEHVNYILCSDEYLLGINNSHLNHDYYTDIITFQFSTQDEPILSDIYISIDRVRENAQNFKVPIAQELLRVIFHGILHNCGFKDQTKAEALLMRQKEEEYLRLYYVPRGTKTHKL